MADREKIIRYYRGTEGAEIAARLVDAAENVLRNRKYRTLEFLDPYGQEIAETVAANYPALKAVFDGGYIGAERQRAVLVHEDFLGKVNFNITAVKAEWNEQYYRLTHRDILGSLLGLGVNRAMFGDILLKNNCAKIIVDGQIAEFVLQNYTSAGAANVSAQICPLEEIEPKEERCKEIKATVASLRVDSVAAAGFGSSRSKISEDIAADKLRVNWQPVKSSSQAVKEGDVISMRGRGRVEVTQVRGQTKKGRTSIALKRYI